MGRKIPDIIKQVARDLRKNMTIGECQFWNTVKSEKIGIRMNRQAPIYLFTENSGLDRYIIADFYCPEKKLIIEIDGSIHHREDVYLLDREKENFLSQTGYQVLRFTNAEVQKSMKVIIETIQNYKL
ncbi:endonuclease domain-containing protein [Candidatus Gracilibacteria bacterium]|nr:endonuclease domain-containing protein [Candidatus Gracilibacteria bacterium]